MIKIPDLFPSGRIFPRQQIADYYCIGGRDGPLAGVLFAPALVRLVTIFLVEAFASFASKFPRSFKIEFWSFVSPYNLHPNAPSVLGTDLSNADLKRFAAAYAIATILLCLSCAVCTLWKSIVPGQLFCGLCLLG
jgi:hypothetical protein